MYDAAAPVFPVAPLDKHNPDSRQLARIHRPCDPMYGSQHGPRHMYDRKKQVDAGSPAVVGAVHE
jgi:hypothetical protein